MSRKGRWLRLDTTWSQSDWLADLPPEERLVWVELLCYTKAHGIDGRVRAGHVTLRRVTGVTRDNVTNLVNAAIGNEALEVDGSDWVVCNWKAYQGDPTAKERQQRKRNVGQQLTEISEESYHRDVTDNTRDHRDVTPTETETKTKTHTTARVRDSVSELRAIHSRGSKAAQEKAYAEIADEVEQETLIRSLAAYVKTLTPEFQGLNLERWLLERRWSGQEIKSKRGSGMLRPWEMDL